VDPERSGVRCGEGHTPSHRERGLGRELYPIPRKVNFSLEMAYFGAF